MYAYFSDNSTGDKVKTQVLRTIQSKLRSAHIEGRNYQYSNLHQLTEFVVNATTAGASNLVMIGNDADFHQLLHAAKKQKNLTFGYIPLLKTDPLGSLLEIANYKQACGALTARKVMSLATISVDDSPIVTQAELVHDRDTDLSLRIDGQLELKLEAHRLKVQNLQTDVHHSRAIGLEVFAHSSASKLPGETKPILKLAHSATPTGSHDKQLLHLSANRVEIKTDKPWRLGVLGEAKTKFLVQITPQPLQIIAKKHTRLNPS